MRLLVVIFPSIPPSSEALNLAYTSPVVSESIAMSIRPFFSSLPRTIFKFIFPSSSPTMTGIAYSSFFWDNSFMTESWRTDCCISLMSILPAAASSASDFLRTFSAVSYSSFCASAISCGDFKASEKSFISFSQPSSNVSPSPFPILSANTSNGCLPFSP